MERSDPAANFGSGMVDLDPFLKDPLDLFSKLIWVWIYIVIKRSYHKGSGHVGSIVRSLFQPGSDRWICRCSFLDQLTPMDGSRETSSTSSIRVVPNALLLPPTTMMNPKVT